MQGERIVEVLKQNKNSPVDVSLQIAIIYAASNNMLAEVPRERIHDFEEELFQYIKASHDEWMKDIHETGVMSKENEELLKSMIIHTREKFLK
jgi:F-type H+-transporting ATPase subunit alpha